MSCLLKDMSAEADAVALGGEGADHHEGVPSERVIPRLEDLFAVPRPLAPRSVLLLPFKQRVALREVQAAHK
jgi:hypothetical protein